MFISNFFNRDMDMEKFEVKSPSVPFTDVTFVKVKKCPFFGW